VSAHDERVSEAKFIYTWAMELAIDSKESGPTLDDLLDLIARVRADERERAAGRVTRLYVEGMAVNPPIRPSHMDILAAIREGGA